MLTTKSSAAASGWAGWALSHPKFGSSVNPITIRGADHAHHITASPPGIENPAASLFMYCALRPKEFKIESGGHDFRK